MRGGEREREDNAGEGREGRQRKTSTLVKELMMKASRRTRMLWRRTLARRTSRPPVFKSGCKTKHMVLISNLIGQIIKPFYADFKSHFLHVLYLLENMAFIINPPSVNQGTATGSNHTRRSAQGE